MNIMHFSDLNADFKRATTFHTSRNCVPSVYVSDLSELAPSKLIHHCVALGAIIHPHQVAVSCMKKLLCPG